MDQEKRSRLNPQISEEAAEWFVAFRTGDVDFSPREFDAWVRRSPEHLRAYIEMTCIWHEASALDAKREIDIDDLMMRESRDGGVVCLVAQEERATSEPTPESRQLFGQVHSPVRYSPSSCGRTHGSLRGSALIASILLLSMGALVVSDKLTSSPTYETLSGEKRVITLPDGSVAELDSRSRLEVRFTDDLRTVELERGQALFHVAKNAARPFIVQIGATRVRAVGTQFDVDRTQTATIITVVEGRVAVTGDFLPRVEGDRISASVMLGAGDQVTVSPTLVPKPTQVNVAETTAWTRWQVVLESATLTEVAAEFNRHGSRKLTVEDRGKIPLRLSGVFTTDPRFLIEYLRDRPDIVIAESGAEVHIIRVAN